MRVAINQPTFLPWMGYFDLMDQVDLFVVLDNVQFSKQSWQQRNRIKTAAGMQWLTVPVAIRGRFGQLIRDVEIRDSTFCRDHIRAIELAYRRSPYFDQYFLTLKQILEELSGGLLADLNLGLIDWAMGVLKIKTKCVRASTLNVTGKRTELLASICERVRATEYLSPLGSATYLLAEQDLLSTRGIQISFQNYDHPEYKQVFTPFEPYASVIDLVFNLGPKAVDVLRGGRRTPFTAAEISTLLNAHGIENTRSIPDTSPPLVIAHQAQR